MAQIDNTFTAFFLDTTTAPWTPLTGLSATIIIREVLTWTVVVNDVAMTEVWGWWYRYVFSDMDVTKDYFYSCDPNSSSAYIESGVTDKRIANLDKSVSEIAVWWNPYITGIGGLQKGIQKIVDKVESKGNEVVKEIEELEDEIIKGIKALPEPIINVTTEKVDISNMEICMKWIDESIKAIKIPEHKEIDLSNVLKEIKSIGKIVDIKFPEQKEIVFNEIIDTINNSNKDIQSKIEQSKESVIEAIGIDKKVSQAFSEFILDRIPNKLDQKKEKENNESEEFMKRPLPNNFTAHLN